MPVILDEGLSSDLLGIFVYLAAVLLFKVGNDTFLILQVNHIHGLRAGPARCWALWRCTIRTRTPGPLYNPCYRAGACLVLWFISVSTPERMMIRATCKTTRAGLGLRDSIYMYIHIRHQFDMIVVMILLAIHVSFDSVRNFCGISSCWPNNPWNHDLLQLRLNILTTDCSVLGQEGWNCEKIMLTAISL